MSDELDRAKKRAVALRYDMENEGAPKVVAKGQGLVAERILELARENGLHIHQDPDLIAVLSRLNVDEEIPAELYHAVAEVLAFVYRINKKLDKSKKKDKKTQS